MEAATFQAWLADQLFRQGIARRELARRLATRHPEGATPATIDSARRQINRYLSSTPVVPGEATRKSIADALGVAPPSDEDEDFDAALDALTREAGALFRRASRLKKARAA